MSLRTSTNTYGVTRLMKQRMKQNSFSTMHHFSVPDAVVKRYSIWLFQRVSAVRCLAGDQDIGNLPSNGMFMPWQRAPKSAGLVTVPKDASRKSQVPCQLVRSPNSRQLFMQGDLRAISFANQLYFTQTAVLLVNGQPMISSAHKALDVSDIIRGKRPVQSETKSSLSGIQGVRIIGTRFTRSLQSLKPGSISMSCRV